MNSELEIRNLLEEGFTLAYPALLLTKPSLLLAKPPLLFPEPPRLFAGGVLSGEANDGGGKGEKETGASEG